jgi:MraZ protein
VTRSIQCEGRLTLTRHPDGCVMLFPRPVWEQHRQQISTGPCKHAPGSAFSSVTPPTWKWTPPAASSSPELRAAVGLDKEVMMMGMGSHFEIWDAAKMAEKSCRRWKPAPPMYSLISLLRPRHMTTTTVPEFQHRTVLLDEAVDALALDGARANGVSSTARSAAAAIRV